LPIYFVIERQSNVANDARYHENAIFGCIFLTFFYNKNVQKFQITNVKRVKTRREW